MRKGKQFSFWHVLPHSKEELQTLIPRKFIQNKKALEEYSVKLELPLLLFVIHKLSNQVTNNTSSPIIEVKRSTLRNFIGKKIHSKNASALDLMVESFLLKLKTNKIKTLFFEKQYSEKILFSFDDSFMKQMVSGNTVSFNLFELTSIRGEKAKMLFLNVLCFDLRKTERYATFSNLVNYIGLSFKNRKNTLKKIKRAFFSLERKGLIEYIDYTGSVDSKMRYRFNYKLKDLIQLS